MDLENKLLIEKINTACEKGDVEEFLSWLTDDVSWTIIGDKNFTGKEDIRQFMLAMASSIPVITVDAIINEGDIGICYGNTKMKGDDGISKSYAFCDIYHFEDNKVSKMTTFIKQIDMDKTIN